MTLTVRELADKLGHPLTEIRQRAVQTLQFKLETGVLTLADLVHEEPVLTQLLRWLLCFCDAQEEAASDVSSGNQLKFVLRLLLDLAQHPYASKTLNRLEMSSVLNHVRLNARLLQTADRLLLDQCQKALASSVSGDSILQQQQQQFTTSSAAASYHVVTATPQQASTATGMMIDRSTPMTALRVFPEIQMMEPPKLPHATMIPFEFVHLSPIDEKFVQDFLKILSNSDDIDVFPKFQWGFDVISVDFGAQLFLQRPHLLKAVWKFIQTENDQQEECLLMVLKLSRLWKVSFQEAMGSIRTSSAMTLANNTPDIAFSMTNSVPVNPHSLISHDHSVSLPYACHDLALRLQPWFNRPHVLPVISSIWETILPFLRLYIESIWDKPIPMLSEDEFLKYRQYVLFYLGKIFDGIRHLQSMDPDAMELKNGQSILMSMAVSTVSQFFSRKILSQHPETCWSIMMHFAECIDSFAAYILANASCFSQNDTLMATICFILRHHDFSVRNQALLAVQNFLQSVDVKENSLWCDEIVCNLLLHNVLDDNALNRNLTIDIIRDFFDAQTNLESLKQFVPLLSCHALPELREIHANVEQLISNRYKLEEQLISALRMMLSKEQPSRIVASKQLVELLGENGRLVDRNKQENHDAFIIRPSSLSVNYAGTSKVAHVDSESISSCMTSLRISFPMDMSLLLGLERYVQLSNENSWDELQHLLLEKLNMLADRSDESQIAVACCLRILYLLTKKDRSLKAKMVRSKEWLITLGTCTFFDHALVRQALAKLIAVLVFGEETLTLSFISPSSDWICVPMFTQMVDQLSSSPALFLPQFIMDNFFIYIPSERVVSTYSFETFKHNSHGTLYLWDNFMENRRFICKQASSMGSVFDSLRKVKSHSDFRKQFEAFQTHFLKHSDFQSFSPDICRYFTDKFISNSPISSEDCLLLGQVLAFLREAVLSCGLSNDTLHVLHGVIDGPILRLLDKDSRNLDEAVRSGDIRMIDSNKSQLAVKLLGFTEAVINEVGSSDIESTLKHTNVIWSLKNQLIKCFASPQISVADRESRISTLVILCKMASCRSFATVTDRTIITDLIAVLTHTLGCLQQSFASLASFTNQDRVVYKLLSLSLKNVARSLLEHPPQDATWIWGPHWLFEGSLEWLLSLLSDDEIRVQKIGLGIIADLILIPESYESITQKIPNFLDMAFTYALDPDRQEIIRKEAFHLINNFVIRFCRDHDLTSATLSKATDRSQNTYLVQLLEGFENCLFFDRLSEIFEPERFILGYPSALTELFMNLMLIAPEHMKQRLSETGLFGNLVKQILSIDSLNSLIYNIDEGGYIPWRVYRRDIFHETRLVGILTAQTHIIRIIRTLYDQQSLAPMIFDIIEPSIVCKRLTSMILEQLPLLESTKPAIELLSEVSVLLAIILPICAEYELASLNTIIDDNIFETFLGLLFNEVVSSRDDVWLNIVNLVSACIRSIITAPILLKQILIASRFADRSEELQTLFRSKIRAILQIKFNKKDFSSIAQLLHCLSLLIKVNAFEANSEFDRFCTDILKDVQSHVKARGMKWSNNLPLIVACADFMLASQPLLQSAKAPSFFHEWASQLLFVLVHSKVGYSSAISTRALMVLVCLLRDFYDKYEEKCVLAMKSEPIGNRNHTTCVISVLADLLLQPEMGRALTGDLITSILQALLAASKSPEIRIFMTKKLLLRHLGASLFSVFKAKNDPMTVDYLKFFAKMTQYTDIHLHLQSFGFLSDLIAIAVAKRKNRQLNYFSLISLRNLAMTRELKMVLLHEENFLNALTKWLIQSQQQQDVPRLTVLTSLLWALVCGNQKAMAVLKKVKMDSLLRDMPELLVHPELKRNTNMIFYWLQS